MGDDRLNHTPNVFLSYRHEDSESVAWSLGDRLKRDLRLENVFLDVRDLCGGDDWRQTIIDRIDASDVVLALIGDRWAGPRADGTSRIFDDDDDVRWEIEYALRIRPAHVVPTMLDGAGLPSALPSTLEPLRRAQRLDLCPADSPVCYCELLADVFMKTHRRRGSPIIVTDGSDEAEAYLQELADQLRSGRLGLDGAVAVTTVTRGFAAIALREGAERWPEVIVLRHPGADQEKLAALVRGVRRNARRVVLAATLGTVAGATFELGTRLVSFELPSPRSRRSGPAPSTRRPNARAGPVRARLAVLAVIAVAASAAWFLGPDAAVPSPIPTPAVLTTSLPTSGSTSSSRTTPVTVSPAPAPPAPPPLSAAPPVVPPGGAAGAAADRAAADKAAADKAAADKAAADAAAAKMAATKKAAADAAATKKAAADAAAADEAADKKVAADKAAKKAADKKVAADKAAKKAADKKVAADKAAKKAADKKVAADKAAKKAADKKAAADKAAKKATAVPPPDPPDPPDTAE